jgi:hypothetical protein
MSRPGSFSLFLCTLLISVSSPLYAFAQSTPSRFDRFNVIVGVVRDRNGQDVGHVLGYGTQPSQAEYLGSYRWDWCPPSFSLAGTLRGRERYGFWTCVRDGYARGRQFFVGNPNGSTVSETNPYYSVVIGEGVAALTPIREFGACTGGSRLIGVSRTYATWTCERRL